jgi:uncharacterized protein YndB with AHSA1/START domain
MKQTDLTLTRTVKATPAEVYDVWIDPKSPGGPWFGSTRLIFEAKIDGLFYQGFVHDGRDQAHYGRFVALERGRRIEHTWVSEATRGIETTVTLTFEETPKGTLVTLKHTGVPDDEQGRQHADGWGFVLGSIEQRFAKR